METMNDPFASQRLSPELFEQTVDVNETVYCSECNTRRSESETCLNCYHNELIEALQKDFTNEPWSPAQDFQDAFDADEDTEERRIILFDGDLRGRYIGEAIQSTAKQYGWQDDEASADDEHYHEATDDAITFLNSLVEGTPYTFTQDGDFYVSEIRETTQPYQGQSEEVVQLARSYTA